ncbi:MAG TPA: amidohydrolase [Gemmatimonadaceae bacterium]|jgi:amidohydrolase|nr:amidohydrolase [Gemmatimonadaceae bacterium]
MPTETTSTATLEPPTTHTAESIRESVIEWRRHLHRNPELSFHEMETSRFVAERLAEIGGLEISRPTPTSVLARLIGARPGPVLAIRADIDALPIEERNSHEFVSRSPGVMHACGHDGHTAMLLGAASILAGKRNEIAGEVRFIFQHAEELLPGGAQELVRAGVLDGVDVVIGAHLWLGLPFGQVGVKAGPLMASPDIFRIRVLGSGGHAAQPHKTVDPIVIAAQVVINLQHIVARTVDPLEPAVVSVTRIAAGTTHNVVPGSVELEGTIRTFDPELRTSIPASMERIIAGVTSAHGARYELEIERGYHSVINDERATDLLRRSVVRALGPDVLVDATPVMGGEDFSAYQQRAAGSFFFIGARNEERGIVFPHHHDQFDVDERALDYGTRIFVAAAFEHLGARER